MRMVAAVAMVVGGVLAMTHAQGGSTLEILFGGGYAFVVSNGHTLEIATIKKPTQGASGYVHHPLKLTVMTGTIDEAKTTIKAVPLGDGTSGWDLTGRTVTVLDNGQEFPNESVTLPERKPVGDCAPVEREDINNLYFVPDVTMIAKQNRLQDDPSAFFDGALTLHGGTIAITKLSPGCYTFRRDGVPVRKQRLVNGVGGIQYSHGFGGDRIVLKLVGKAGKTDEIHIKPDAQQKIRLDIESRHAGVSKPGPINFFRHFYRLLHDNVLHMEIPTWDDQDVDKTRDKRQEKTPGEACPPGFYFVS